ncbi:hypothetical protein [Aestuariivirga sp.]|uniref:hypothetical protein n=1 Tax=Aestuariivirga sp. TaxID=2650926 RepID=UPI0039E476E4
MGLGISLIAKKPSRRFFGVFARETDWKQVFEKSLREAAQESGVAIVVPPSVDSPDRIAAHYCEEWLDFIQRDDAIILQARTSSCGPGYHAFLVDAVDRLKSQALIEFGEDEDYFDETGYFSSRDYEALRGHHASWLQAVAKQVSGHAVSEGSIQMVSLSLDGIYPNSSDDFVLTPRGPVAREQFEKIASAGDKTLLEFASNWFPWWDRTPSAEDWIRTARTLLWVDVPWHVPAGDNERRVMEAAVECCNRAHKASTSTDFPATEIREITALLAEGAAWETVPSPKGIGYRRALCNRHLGYGWSIALPGYWYEMQDGDSSGFTFAGQEVWYSSFTVKKKPEFAGSDAPLDLPAMKENEVVQFEFTRDKLNIRLEKLRDQPQGQQFGYRLVASRSDGLLVVTFSGYLADWEKTIPEISRSVRSPPTG